MTNLKQLIEKTESMDEAEKETFIELLPSMNLEQLEKLQRILLKEKKGLDKLDEDYRNSIKNI